MWVRPASALARLVFSGVTWSGGSGDELWDHAWTRWAYVEIGGMVARVRACVGKLCLSKPSVSIGRNSQLQLSGSRPEGRSVPKHTEL